MVKKIRRSHSGIRAALVRTAKIHILIGLVLASQIMLYDAGKLITPDVVLDRWKVAGLLVAVAVLCWFLARTKQGQNLEQQLVWSLVILDIGIASYAVYSQRGMASRAVFLFVLPILTAAVLQRKGAVYLAAVFSVIAYVLTSVAYFVWNFNEGYKLELYGEVGFYSAMLLFVAALTWTLVRSKH